MLSTPVREKSVHSWFLAQNVDCRSLERVRRSYFLMNHKHSLRLDDYRVLSLINLITVSIVSRGTQRHILNSVKILVFNSIRNSSLRRSMVRASQRYVTGCYIFASSP